MRCGWRSGVLVAVLGLAAAGSGCSTARGPAGWRVKPAGPDGAWVTTNAVRTLQQLFAPEYHAVHRAIITRGRHQYVCDGRLSVSPREGWHLALVSALGAITDVRVQSDGTVEVLRVTPLFREDWTREHVARELGWLFIAPAELELAGRLEDGRWVLAGPRATDGVQARYLFSADGRRWEELEVVNGTRRVCHAHLGGYRSFPGFTDEVPGEMDLEADTHRLQLRIIALWRGAEGRRGRPQ